MSVISVEQPFVRTMQSPTGGGGTPQQASSLATSVTLRLFGISHRVSKTVSLTMSLLALTAVLGDAEDDVRTAIEPRRPGIPGPKAQPLEFGYPRQLGDEAIAERRNHRRIERGAAARTGDGGSEQVGEHARCSAPDRASGASEACRRAAAPAGCDWRAAVRAPSNEAATTRWAASRSTT